MFDDPRMRPSRYTFHLKGLLLIARVWQNHADVYKCELVSFFSERFYREHEVEEQPVMSPETEEMHKLTVWP